MVTISTAENALKSAYLDVVSDQINTKSSAFLSRINQTDKDVYGKEIIKAVPYGLNGAISSQGESAVLVTASNHNFINFKSSLKNFYGSISISDKAMRAGQNSKGSFVNFLNDEMESMVNSCCFNMGRMLYNDGSALLATITSIDANSRPVFDTVKNFIEGMRIDIYSGTTLLKSNVQIAYVDRVNKQIVTTTSMGTLIANCTVFATGSKNNELTGIKLLFDTSNDNKVLYGVDRTSYPWLYPYINSNGGSSTEIDDLMIQAAINSIEEVSGRQPDFIPVSADVRSAYQAYLSANKRNLDIITLEDGYKAMTYSGIPIVYERFIDDGTMYLLNTKDFNLHQLCDWSWLENACGGVLVRNSNYAAYFATLVKYAELICDRPGAQGRITNIKSTYTDKIATITNALSTFSTNYATVNAESLTE